MTFNQRIDLNSDRKGDCPESRRHRHGYGSTDRATLTVADETVRQTTLRTSINCVGIGLHTGGRIGMTLHPAPAGSGVRFRRVDAAGRGTEIPADLEHVVDTRLNTCLGAENGVTINTVEHVLSALHGLGIDNILIEIDGPEVPAMDGSAAPFVFLIECAGIETLDAPRMALKVLKTVSFEDGDARVSIAPASHGLTVDFNIAFSTAAIARQRFSTHVSPELFRAEVARARTFGFMQDVERLREAGLARGGSLENAVVIEGDRILNEDGLRFGDEFVRHKALDAIGDLYTAGKPLIGHFSANRSGHAHTHGLLKALFADPDALTEVAMTDATAHAPLRAASA